MDAPGFDHRSHVRSLYSAAQDVRVNHMPLDTNQIVRLIIDGIDVTVYSDMTSRGLFHENSKPGPVDPDGRRPHR